MNIITTLLFLTVIKLYSCQDITKLFDDINKETTEFNAAAAKIAWDSALQPYDPELPNKSAIYQKSRIIWQHSVCQTLSSMKESNILNEAQLRQKYLLCRGPKYTFNEAREISSLYEELQSIYSDAKVCIPSTNVHSKPNLTDIQDAILNYLSAVKVFFNLEYNDTVSLAAKIAANESTNVVNTICLEGEKDIERMMQFSRYEDVLKWLWLVWRKKVGPPMKDPYRRLVSVENQAARRNGYTDIGDSWRKELEIPNLRQFSRHLYASIRPLYALLHGVVRFYLRVYYGDLVPEYGPIPAHLLGDLWSHNWEAILDLIVPNGLNLDERIQNMNWTVNHMVKRAEDFYQSLGLPPMSDKFWSKSVFSRANEETRCHGTAADMFRNGDYRLLYCSGTSFEDFYVLHHELGHIQYYMAYEDQPGIFRQANAALHESIGETVMLGVMTLQHLHRLGLINDTILYATKNSIKDNEITNSETNFTRYDDKDFGQEKNMDDPQIDELLNYGDVVKEKVKFYTKIITDTQSSIDMSPDEYMILKQALNKLPQIPFALLIDEYRWKYFEGTLKENEINQNFWEMVRDMQGIAPPGKRGNEYFDIGAKYHVPDNTPYMRYFLSSFIQHQLFETLCKTAVFGQRNIRDSIPATIAINQCDIYGSKAAGKVLKDLMSRGHSQHWSEILRATTGSDVISASALKRYYRPLYKLLGKLVKTYHIPIGW